MKKAAAAILAVSLALSLTGPALAAGESGQFAVRKTNVRADSVANYEGYGAIAMGTDETDDFDRALKQSALMDATGKVLFPYQLNDTSDVTFRYVYSEGFVTLNRGTDQCRYDADAQFYTPEGKVALRLPDVSAQLLSELKAAGTDPNYDPVVGGPNYWVSPFHDGVAFVRAEYYLSQTEIRPNGYSSGVSANAVCKAWLIDTKGNILCELPEEYSDFWTTSDDFFWAWMGTASEGLIPVVVKGRDEDWEFQLKTFGYLDYSGNLALDLKGSYSNRGPFTEGLAWVKDSSGKYGFIDKSGTPVIPCQYDNAYYFDGGIAPVKKGGKWGAIDAKGNVVIPFRFDDSFGAGEGYMTVGQNGRYGLVDRLGNVVIPIEYDDISVCAGGVVYAIKDGYVYILTKTGTAYVSTQTVTIDGRPVELQAYALKDEYGYMTNYVKLRDVAYALNGSKAQFQVGWDGSVNVVTGSTYTANGSEMHTPFAGDRSFTVPTAGTKVDGIGANLSAIVLRDDNGGGYTYYKLRDLGKALNFNVGWSAEKGIYIETDKPYAG